MRLRGDIVGVVLLLAVAVGVPVALRGPWAGECVRVGDGDTITVNRYGRDETVRLHGVDCPESDQAFGTQAKTFTTTLCLDKVLRVYPVGKDQYGRTVAVVKLPHGTDLGEALVGYGFAWWFRRYAPDNTRLRDLEANARARRLGLWAAPNPVAPWEFRHR